MEQDIVPSLLKAIQADFKKSYEGNSAIARVARLVDEGTATYKEVNDYATWMGQLLSAAIKRNVTADALPDGRMYYNIAERIMNTTLKDDHDLIVTMAEKVQENLNRQAGIGIKAIKPAYNTSRADGIIDRLSNETDFNKIKWILAEPIVNFHESIVDAAIKSNAEFHAASGIPAVVHRITSGKCCDWCDNLAGKYTYPDVPDDIYRRHDYCRCTVEYDPGEGKKQNVWSKRWR